jgi:hypothetical protein
VSPRGRHQSWPSKPNSSDRNDSGRIRAESPKGAVISPSMFRTRQARQIGKLLEPRAERDDPTS